MRDRGTKAETERLHIEEFKLETCADSDRDSKKVKEINNERQRGEEKDREVKP